MADDARRRTARQRAALAARRANARNDSTTDEAEPPRGRRWIVAVVTCTAVLVAVVVIALVNSREPTRAASTELTATPVSGTGALAITPPDAYTVTYRLESSDTDTSDVGALDTGGTPVGTTTPAPRSLTTSTEQFRVQRPFRTQIDSRAGAPPGGEAQWSIISDLGVSSSLATGAKEPDVETILPSAGIGDWRLDATLADLTADGRFVPRDRRSLLGRECEVYRTGSPLENYDVTAPTESTYADVCIDGSGLLLEQVAIRDGQLTEHLTATAVDTTPKLGDDDFAITGSPAPLSSGGMRLTLIQGQPTDESYWSMPAPAGYEFIGCYTLEQNAPGSAESAVPADTGGVSPTTVVTSYVDVYTHGRDTITVHQGPTSVERVNDAPAPTTASVAELGQVDVDSKLTGSEIVAHPPTTPDWFVTISGTVPRAALVQIADMLRH